MRYILILLLILVSIWTYAQQENFDHYQYLHENPERNFPIQKDLLNDYVNLLTQEEQASLNDQLSKYRTESSHSIIWVIVQDIAPYNNLIDYTNDLSNFWKIDPDGENEIIIALGLNIQDIRIKSSSKNLDKLSIEFLEGLISSTLIPAFNEGEFKKGIQLCTEQIITAWGK